MFVNYIKATLLDALDKGRVGDLILVFASNVVDVLLVLLHARDVLFERDLFLTRGRCAVTDQISNLLAVGSVFVDSKFQVLTELLVKFLEILLVLSQLFKQFHAFLDQVLADNLSKIVTKNN